MGFPCGTADSSSTNSYTGEPSLVTDGEKQTQTWNSGLIGGSSVAITESVPSQTVVSISGTGVVKIGNAQNQFKVTKSLANGQFQIYGHIGTCHGTDSDNASGTYVFVSRNSHVCTVSQSGVVTPIGRGQAVVEVRYSRACRVPIVGAVPSFTEAQCVFATLDVTVVA